MEAVKCGLRLPFINLEFELDSLGRVWKSSHKQHDDVSLALGLEPSRWAERLAAATSHEHLDGSPSLLSSAGFAAGLAGFARRCGVCLASFPSTWLLERHAILQHAGQPGDDKPFTCEQCGQRYRYRSAYVKHREQNHRARLPADKLFTCDVCGMQFRYLKSFKKHRLNHALERLQRAPSSESASLTERSDQVSSTGEPSQHLESGSAGDASPFHTELEERGRETPALSEGGAREEAGCSSGSASVQDNPAEFESQQEEPIDLASGSGAGSDAEDTAIIDEERPLSSATMASTTSLNLSNTASGALQHHQPARVANNAATLLDRRERRFACPFCGKCVRSKENLKLHVRKHTGERPFVCLFCGRAFGGKSDLTRHLRIHTGERPYHCEMCGKCFARADYLSKHLTTHIHQR
ncbi:hypothetical protein QAD02_010522 [Eretmocerus hayati]|uniref:Uncharacterized protein n=1 Tax=Eretmocerus hayati TaxID=131215 RepID=A0ACC2NUA5_9HYME|nr:hypothetical protein QAD02_010522 [Eretmocerus hayati]